MIAIGAGIAALACIGAGIGIGIATSKAAETDKRQMPAFVSCFVTIYDD